MAFKKVIEWVYESQDREGGLPPQRGCPAGDPGLAPAPS